MKVIRTPIKITVEELRQMAQILARIECARSDLLRLMNGRVLVAWLDPLLTAGRAMKYFDKLRNELDNDWYELTDEKSPFSGPEWNQAAYAVPET